MDPITITATSEEEALAKASQSLGLPVDQLKAEVVERKAGLFGKESLTVLVTPPAEPEPESAPAPKAAEKTEEEPKPRRRRRAAAKPAEEEEAKPTKPASRKPATKKADTTDDDKTKAEDEDKAPVIATEEDGEKLVGILRELLELSGLEVEANVTQLSGKYVHISIDGEDVSFLVGRRGEVLNQLQYLMNVTSARQLDNGVRVVLDGDNYRKQREDVLTKLATDIATQVKERGEEAVLEALPAFERRVVHRALVDFEGISTYSEGEEPERCVVIAPSD